MSGCSRRKLTPETRLKRQVTSLLKSLQIFSYHLMGGLGSYPGAPDRVVRYQGRVFYFEFKAKGGRLSDHQRAFRERCQRDGIPYHVIRSPEDAIKALGLRVLV